MKSMKLLSTAALALFLSNQSQAQLSSFSENLDINLFNIRHMVHGDMWYNDSTYQPACEYPKGSGKHASFLASLWMSGWDNAGTLYVSAQMYRSTGVDYYPGPLDATGSLSSATTTDWAKIWKVDAVTISSFKSLFSSGGSAAITAAKYDVIKEWPAKGNIYAKGNAGAALPQLLGTGVGTKDFAPFVDVNGDGIYNWKDGDYPMIKGDQMLWWVFSDNGPTHSASKGRPLKIQFNAMAYGYSRGTDVDRMVFYEFTMSNKSTELYNDFRVGVFSDADLGSSFDDYIAFDSVHRMGIEYNARIPDGANGDNSYGNHPPMTGISFIEMPGDVFPSAMLPTGCFNYFRGYYGAFAGPKIDTQYNHSLRSKGSDGIPRYYGDYAFPISKGATMCDSNYLLQPFDPRFVIVTNDFSFASNSRIKVSFVLLATDTTGNACPDGSFKPITDLADTAWKIYYNPLPTSIRNVSLAKTSFKLYPNPAQNTLYVQTLGKANKAESIKIIDALGKTIQLPIVRQNNQYEINTSSLASGLYSVVYFDGEQTSAQHFVKE